MASIDPTELQFLNEGASSIVFAYIGGRQNRIGSVLRVPKRPCLDDEDAVRRRIRSLFSCLLGDQYVLEEELIMIPAATVRQLLTQSASVRSPARVDDFGPHTMGVRTAAVLDWPAWFMPNLTWIDGIAADFAVELKPKWAFVPTQSMLRRDPGWTDAHRAICRFCMHQWTKVARREQAQRSAFCPLNLFSSSGDRRRLALADLVRTPQNNLRVFDRDHRPVPDITSFEVDGEPIAIVDLVHDVVTKHLKLLSAIQRAQLVTTMSIRTSGVLFDQLTVADRAELDADTLPQRLVDEIVREAALRPTSVLAEYDACPRSPPPAAVATENPQLPIEEPPCSASTTDSLRRLLVAMAARDLSIMITFGRQINAPAPAGPGRAGPWRSRIAVIDLETKYPRRIDYWRRLDAELIEELARVAPPNRSVVQ